MNSDSPARGGSGSYRAAGVDIDAADLAKERITQLIAATHGPEVLRGVGHFGGFFQAPGPDNPFALVSSVDSVGTKILVALLAHRYDSIGIDIVNHCANDLLACGARPLFFLDYFATAAFEPERFVEVVGGMTSACRAAGCAFIGGETAQLPGIYQEGTYDLAGCMVGLVERARIIDGSTIEAGDVLIGLPSDGLHTNGYSLARLALGLDTSNGRKRLEDEPDELGESLGDALLTPHRSYLPEVLPLLDGRQILGMAHITGGGIAGNVRRIIPPGLEAVIDVGAWQVPPLFRLIQSAGGIEDAEMYRVFNMGIGFVMIVRAADEAALVGRVDGARRIGMVQPADQTGARYEGLSDAASG